MAEDEQYFNPDQFGNPLNVECHYKTTAREIVRQVSEFEPTIDAFVAGIGTGGTLIGVGKALREINPAAHLAAVEPDESAVMQQADSIGKAETELHKQRLAALIGIRALLTEEQREELSRIREETREEWLERLVDSCDADIDGLCPDADDPWSRRGCARAHWDELSADCQNAIESARARRGHHRGKHHGRRGMGGF